MNKELEDLKIELMLNGKAQYFYNIEDFFCTYVYSTKKWRRLSFRIYY